METTPKGNATKLQLGPIFLGLVFILAIFGIMTEKIIKAIWAIAPLIVGLVFIWVLGTMLSTPKHKDKE